MNIDFDKLACIDNGCIAELNRSLRFSNQQSGMLLKFILHTLRNNMTYAESAEFIASLPNGLKIIYIEDWRIHVTPFRLKTFDDLVAAVVSLDDGRNRIFTTLDDAEQIILKALAVLENHINLTSQTSIDKTIRRSIVLRLEAAVEQ